MPKLTTALRIIHADGEWWRKVAAGGALWATIVGWPIVEGYQLESLENSQRGFPTPLPLWHGFANKAVVGIFALVIDFFFFVFPVLIGGMAIFCGTLAATLSGGEQVARPIALSGFGIMCIYMLLVWMTGASAVAKQRFVLAGDLQQALSASLIRELLRAPARGPYLQARLQSLPLYLPVAILVWLTWSAGAWSWGLALIVGWVTLSLLVYVRLATIQLYLAATREVERLRFSL
jgi:hypothetical protein